MYISLLFTDLHLNSYNKDICIKFIDNLISSIKIHKVNNIVFLGDFFDYRKGQDEPTLTCADIIFNKLNSISIPIYMISGNHDKFIQNSRNSYLNHYNNIYAKIYIYDSIKKIKINDSINYFFFPYFEGELFDEQLKELIKLSSNCKGTNILFAHYMYEQLPNELLKNFYKIFLGHNHERENFPKGQYIGSCIQQGFCEDKYKGFSFLNDKFDTKQIIFQDKEYITQKIDLNIFSEEESKKYILNFKNKYPNKYLRIEFNGFNKDINSLKEFCKNNNIDYISRIENILNNNDSNNNNLIISDITDNQIKKYYKDFVKEQNIDNNVDKILSEYLFVK